MSARDFNVSLIVLVVSIIHGGIVAVGFCFSFFVAISIIVASIIVLIPSRLRTWRRNRQVWVLSGPRSTVLDLGDQRVPLRMQLRVHLHVSLVHYCKLDKPAANHLEVSEHEFDSLFLELSLVCAEEVLNVLNDSLELSNVSSERAIDLRLHPAAYIFVDQFAVEDPEQEQGRPSVQVDLLLCIGGEVGSEDGAVHVDAFRAVPFRCLEFEDSPLRGCLVGLVHPIELIQEFLQ